MRRIVGTALSLGTLSLVAAGLAPAQGATETATPGPLVAAYDSLADTILGAKKTEWNLVHSILATTYGHAEATFQAARAKLQAKKDARADIENLAELVAQLGNEGDAAVAAVRKRLLEGGHHHHAGGEQQGVYDKGFVIVTRAAKKVFLDAASAIGKLAGSADAGALDAQWRKVETQFKELHRGVEP